MFRESDSYKISAFKQLDLISQKQRILISAAVITPSRSLMDNLER
jgi:hypothetical protein